MTKPRTKTKIKFPFVFQKNGRTGKIYKLGNGTFKTNFTYAGEPKQNTFKSFEAAYQYLDTEFLKLDTDKANALSLHPLNGSVKDYAELEQLCREQTGQTLRNAVDFLIQNHKTKKLDPKTVTECIELFLKDRESNNVSTMSLRTFKKHLNRFGKVFGARQINEITTLEISTWLKNQKDEKTKKHWGASTKTKVRGTIVSLSIYAQKELKAIPDNGDTEFQNVKIPNEDEKAAVEIYTPAEFKKQLYGAVKYDIELIPGLIAGGMFGLRPYEFHAEGLKRDGLKWEAFNWHDKILHFKGQKIRTKGTRDIAIQAAAEKWLAPFEGVSGVIWKNKKVYDYRMKILREKIEREDLENGVAADKAGVNSIRDGLRHSYASYRIKQLKGNLAELAAEMGNSPAEIIDSYKRNVTEAEAEAWFGILPPHGYGEKVCDFILG